MVIPSSFPFSNRVYTVYLDFSSLSRFGFVLTRNGFKFETRVNYSIINLIITSKIYYNPKRVIFLNWANFIIFQNFGTRGVILHFKESISNIMTTKNSNTIILIVNLVME